MIPINKLPDLDWNEIARREISLTGEGLVERSTFAYRVKDVAAAGLVYQTFLAPPWFWFVLAETATMRDLIDFRRLQVLIPPGALTAVDVTEPLAERFAKFYGFVSTGEQREYAGRTYNLFRRT